MICTGFLFTDLQLSVGELSQVNHLTMFSEYPWIALTWGAETDASTDRHSHTHRAASCEMGACQTVAHQHLNSSGEKGTETIMSNVEKRV